MSSKEYIYNWEDRFNEEFVCEHVHYGEMIDGKHPKETRVKNCPEDIKQFISELLQEQAKEIIKDIVNDDIDIKKYKYSEDLECYSMDLFSHYKKIKNKYLGEE